MMTPFIYSLFHISHLRWWHFVPAFIYLFDTWYIYLCICCYDITDINVVILLFVSWYDDGIYCWHYYYSLISISSIYCWYLHWWPIGIDTFISFIYWRFYCDITVMTCCTVIPSEGDIIIASSVPLLVVMLIPCIKALMSAILLICIRIYDICDICVAYFIICVIYW